MSTASHDMTEISVENYSAMTRLCETPETATGDKTCCLFRYTPIYFIG